MTPTQQASRAWLRVGKLEREILAITPCGKNAYRIAVLNDRLRKANSRAQDLQHMADVQGGIIDESGYYVSPLCFICTKRNGKIVVKWPHEGSGKVQALACIPCFRKVQKVLRGLTGAPDTHSLAKGTE